MGIDFGQVFKGFVPTAVQLDENELKRQQWEKSYGLQREAADRAKTEFDWRGEDRTRANDIRKKQQGILDAASQINDLYTLGNSLPDGGAISPELFGKASKFYNDHPVMQNGMRVSMVNLDGTPMIIHGTPGSSTAQIMPATKESFMQGIAGGHDLIAQQLGMTSPEAYQSWYKQMKDNGFKDTELGIKRFSANSEDNYRKGQLSAEDKKLRAQIPLWQAQANQANSHARLFDRMPQENGGAGAMTDEQAAQLAKAIQYHEAAGQLGRTAPDAANRYRMEAANAINTLPGKFQLQVGSQLMKDQGKANAPFMTFTDFAKAFPGLEPAQAAVQYQLLGSMMNPEAVENMKPRATKASTQDPTKPEGAYRVKGDGQYMIMHPGRGLMTTKDYSRIFGDDWADLPPYDKK